MDRGDNARIFERLREFFVQELRALRFSKVNAPRATGVENREIRESNNFFVGREWAHWIRRKKLVLVGEKSLGKAQGGRELRGSKL